MTISKTLHFLNFLLITFLDGLFAALSTDWTRNKKSALKIPLLNVFNKCFASLAIFGSFGVKGVQIGSEKKEHVWTEVKHDIASQAGFA
jgi:hypothetical protein